MSGSAAHYGGIKSGDILFAVGNRSFEPPEHPIFPMGQKVEVKVLTDGLSKHGAFPHPRARGTLHPAAISPDSVSVR
jgi:hypothetical protein